MSFININEASPTTAGADTLNFTDHMEKILQLSNIDHLLSEKEQCSLSVSAFLVPCPLSNSSWTWVKEADGKYIISINSLHTSSQAAPLQCVRHFKIRVIGAISNYFWIATLFLTIMYMGAANTWEPLCKSCKSQVSHSGHAGIFYVFSVLCSKVCMKNWGNSFESPWSFQSKLLL